MNSVVIAKPYLQYNGKCYDVGTKLRFKAFNCSYSQKDKIGTITEICGTQLIIISDDGEEYLRSSVANWWSEGRILEIIEPVYYEEKCKMVDRNYLFEWQIEECLTWYIIIMVVGAIFEERWLLWVVATILLIARLGGFLSRNKK